MAETARIAALVVRQLAGPARRAALCLTLFAGACTSVPETEFTAYTQAFDAAKQSTEQILVAMDGARATAETIERGRQPAAAPAGPFPISISLTNTASIPEDQTAKRRRALETVSHFNAVLVELAAGRKPEEIRSSVDSLISGLKDVASLAGFAVPVPGGAGALIATVVEQLEKASNRQQFADALREAAPLIDAIFANLAKDAEDVYEIMARSAKKDVDRTLDQITDGYVQLRMVAAEHRAPTGTIGEGYAKFTTALGAALKQAGLDDPTKFTTRLPTAGSKDFDAMMLSQLEQTLAQLQAAADAYSAIVAKQQAFYRLVVAYGALLAKTRETLQAVRLALDRPPDIRAQATELLAFAFDVKRKLQAVRDAQAAIGGP
jgi:hypothetical protein